jgi:ferredoxin
MPELWLIQVDGTQCVGSALCVHLAPEHFELGEDVRSCPRKPVAEYSQDVADAVALCPAGAISYSRYTSEGSD